MEYTPEVFNTQNPTFGVLLVLLVFVNVCHTIPGASCSPCPATCAAGQVTGTCVTSAGREGSLACDEACRQGARHGPPAVPVYFSPTYLLSREFSYLSSWLE